MALCACEASPHLPEEQVSLTPEEMKTGRSVDSIRWNQDWLDCTLWNKQRRCSLTQDMTKIQAARDPHRGQQDSAVAG